MSNLRTGKKCSHNSFMVMNRFVDWCQLCGAIRTKRHGKTGVKYSWWLTPPAKKRAAVRRFTNLKG